MAFSNTHRRKHKLKKIKVEHVMEFSHSLMNDVVVSTAGQLNEAHIVLKLDDLLKERNLSQKDLANMTGMRVGTISELVNGKGISINKVQILSIMVALRLTDLSQIIEIRLPDDIKTTYQAESDDWISSREMPISVKELYTKNVLQANLGNKA